MVKIKRIVNVEIDVSFDSKYESRMVELIHDNGSILIDLLSNKVTPKYSILFNNIPQISEYNEILLNKELFHAYSIINEDKIINNRYQNNISNGLFAAQVSEIVRRQSKSIART